jgi:hypothetical protein
MEDDRRMHVALYDGSSGGGDATEFLCVSD